MKWKQLNESLDYIGEGPYILEYINSKGELLMRDNKR